MRFTRQFNKLFTIPILIIAVSIFSPFSGWASENFDSAISNATLEILEKLTYAEKLKNKKLAVLGFEDVTTNSYCKDLSLLLANKITSELDRFRPIAKEKYQIMSRHNLDAIETESVISKKDGSADFDVFTDLLGKSDILITGTWQDGQDAFDLTIRALEISSGDDTKGAKILASICKRISKLGLPKSALVCLGEHEDIKVEGNAAEQIVDREAPAFQINYVYRSSGIGELKTIKENELLQSGDHYKIIFAPDQDCYVYIFQVDSSGQIYQLFPMASFGGVRVDNFNPVKAGKAYILPSPEKAFVLDRQVGLERFYFIHSKDQNRNLDQLYSELVKARDVGDNLKMANTQDKLKKLFKRRGPAKIVVDQPVQIAWENNKDIFSLIGQKLQGPCDNCVNVLEFVHQ